MRLIAPLAAALLASTAALALETPQPGKADPRVMTAVYRSDEVIYLHLTVGHTLAITLPADEIRNESFGSDSEHLKAAIPAGTNLILLKPIAPMPPKSFFIHAKMPDDSNRLYAFQVDVEAPDAGNQDPYSLTISDPAAVIAARQGAYRAWKAKEEAKATEAALRERVKHPVDTNFKYLLQGEKTGDWNLLPTREVADDNNQTHFHFPGQRAPVITVVSPDGTEAAPDCSPDSETHITTCYQLAAQWRLRDGNNILCIFNLALDPIGTPNPSHTADPDVRREVREVGP